MKKLDLKQMENLQGGYASKRACMLMGGLAVLSWFGGAAAGIGAAIYTVAECA